MAEKFEKFTSFADDMEIIQKLGNNPNADNGLNEAELKAKFDESGIKIKAYLLTMIDQLNKFVDDLNSQYDNAGNVMEGGTMLGVLNMNGFPIRNLPEPVAPGDPVPLSAATNMKIATAVLASSSWVNKAQTVSVDGIIPDSDRQAVITVASAASHELYLDSGIMMTESGEGTLTFTCDELPSENVSVNVLILTKGV